MAFCKLMFIGNLGRDPEMRYTPTGRPVTQFTVAVNQSTKNQQTGEWTEETDWFRVSVFGDRAERAAEQLRKGNRVFVEGRFRTREFEGQDGQKRTSPRPGHPVADRPRTTPTSTTFPSDQEIQEPDASPHPRQEARRLLPRPT